MFYKVKVNIGGNGKAVENYIYTNLDAETVDEISRAIDACADFSMYDGFREAYIKAWLLLLIVLRTSKNNNQASDTASLIMSRARLEVS